MVDSHAIECKQKWVPIKFTDTICISLQQFSLCSLAMLVHNNKQKHLTIDKHRLIQIGKHKKSLQTEKRTCSWG